MASGYQRPVTGARLDAERTHIMSKNLKVGIIGASPSRGWARISHNPAIHAVEGLDLHAVVTQSQASADEAARQYGAAVGYGDAQSLFADPEVDIVTVAVNVPAHRDLVLAALAAGKHLFCEYPLGRDAAEAEALAQAARDAGVHAAIGLQLRAAPAVQAAQRLIAEGTLGRLRSVRVLSTTMAFGPEVEAALAFAEDGRNGVTLATIQGAHTLDLVTALLGDFAEPLVRATTQFPTVMVEGQVARTRTVADHLLLVARTAEGAPVSVEVAGGWPAEDTPFQLLVVGTRGRLELEGGAPRGVQSGALHLRVDGVLQDTEALFDEPATAVNVAGVYAALRDDIRNGTRTAAGFDDAVRTQRLMESVLNGAAVRPLTA